MYDLVINGVANKPASGELIYYLNTLPWVPSNIPSRFFFLFTKPSSCRYQQIKYTRQRGNKLSSQIKYPVNPSNFSLTRATLCHQFAIMNAPNKTKAQPQQYSFTSHRALSFVNLNIATA